MKTCPCGSNLKYLKCCRPYLQGENIPPTPEALMRSRYTAFSRGNIDYIEATQHGKAAEDFDKESAKEWASSAKFKKLEIISAPFVSEKDDTGHVEFKAHFSELGQRHILHEKSVFKQINGRWHYVNRV